MLEAIPVNRACAFCEKREWQVEYLVEGRSAYICNECVTVSTDLLAQQRASPEGAPAQRIVQGFTRPERSFAFEVIGAHFAPLPPDTLVTATRTFPARMRVDLQRSLDRYVDGQQARAFHGLHYRFSYETVG